MQITLIENKKIRLLFLGLTLLFGFTGLVLKLSVGHVVLTTLLFAAVLFFRVRFKEDLQPIWLLPLFLISSTLIFVLMQYVITAGFSCLTVFKTALNILVIFSLQGILFAICGNVRASVVSIAAFSILLGLIDYFVVQTRSMEIFFSDIFSISTGLSVAGSYKFTASVMTRTALAYSIVFLILVSKTVYPKFRKATVLRLSSACAGLLIGIFVSWMASTSLGVSISGIQDKYWKYYGSKYNGFYVRLIRSVSATMVLTPSGYSADTLQKLLEEYYGISEDSSATTSTITSSASSETTSNQPVQTDPSVTEGGDQSTDSNPSGEETSSNHPNIIVIMDETFSDLQAISAWMIENGYDAELLETNIETLPFFSSLSSSQSGVEKGWALSSVYGGNTANSEFEFLTGNSMAFLPVGSVAYNLYLNADNTFSLVDLLNDYGYYTVSMHPETGSNWNRNKIYSCYGFDKSYFLDDFSDLTEEDYYREHVSDQAVFQKIVDLYKENEEASDSPFFAFAVTMMNHGGYYTQDFDYTVTVNRNPGRTGTAEYLSSIHESDAALQELIAYFSSVEEDTIIVFFGDHQPALSDSFYQQFFGISDDSDDISLQAKYAVPYLIWANFDFESNETENSLTSLNFLSGRLLEIAGLEKTEYLKLISEIREEYPCITASGYWDREGNFYSFSTYSADDVNLLRLYKYMQYNALFDSKSNKLYDWFTLSPSRWTGQEVTTEPELTADFRTPVTSPPAMTD